MLSNQMRNQLWRTVTQQRVMMFSNRVFVQGIPSDWDKDEINSRFSLAGKLSAIHMVKNQSGQNTGKVVLTYEKEASAEQAIARFDNRAVENLIVNVKPFFEGGIPSDKRPRNEQSLLARRVYLMNVPYDATHKELESLVSEFAPVETIVVPRDKSGLARGFAFAYLKNEQDVDKVIEYVDGRHLRSR